MLKKKEVRKEGILKRVDIEFVKVRRRKYGLRIPQTQRIDKGCEQ